MVWALDQLSSALRKAVILCDVDDMTSSQAGDVLDIPEGTVRTRLFHARIRLKAILADEVTP